MILTTNFDWLIEDAIHKEREKPPTLVASPSEIRGMSPLNTQECLVIHLHGHHLNPTGMLNTAEELNAYPSEVEDLLDEIFPKYGLIIAGWSAIWDNALRTAIDRNPTGTMRLLGGPVPTEQGCPSPVRSTDGHLRARKQLPEYAPVTSVDYLRLSMAAVNGSFHEFAHKAAVRSSPPDVGVFPATPFYPDEIGRWADAAGG